MFKVLTVALLVFNFSSVWAQDNPNLNLTLTVENIVRSKLWYEGVTSSAQNINSDVAVMRDYPEELIVALDKIDLE